jgi:hypothetical protein
MVKTLVENEASKQWGVYPKKNLPGSTACEKFHKARLRVRGRAHIVRSFFRNA